MAYNDHQLIPSSNTMITTIMFITYWFLLMIPFAFPAEEDFGSNNYHCNLASNSVREINQYSNSTRSATASELINKTASSGGYFYTIHIDFINREVTYAMAICPADIPDANCTACVQKATTDLMAKCGYTSGIIYEPRCVFKYSDNEFEKEVDTDPNNGVYMWSPLLDQAELWVNYSSPNITRNLITTIAIEAASGNHKFYASSYSELNNGSGFDIVYGMAMCIRGLPPGGCGECLNNASSTLSVGFDKYRSFYVGLGSCIIRYSTFDFLSN